MLERVTRESDNPINQCDAYATEIQQEITDAVLNALPDLDNSLAKL